MGNRHSAFTEDELEEYRELTYLSEAEIFQAYKKFSQLAPELIDEEKNGRIPYHLLMTLPQLGNNPFRGRILRVFSTCPESCGMTFEDFLDMVSVFSKNAPKSLKVHYAFKIYDFNEDGLICRNDIRNVVETMCGEREWNEEDLERLIDNFFKEADMDDDNCLDFAEFDNVINKCPDFIQTFQFRL